MILLAVLLPLAAGWGLLQWAPPPPHSSIGERWALSFLLGQLALCLIFFGLSMGFGGAPAVTVGSLLATLALSGLPIWRRRERPVPIRLTPASGWEAAPAVMALVMGLQAALLQRMRPILAHDGFAIYAVKAVAYFRDGGITTLEFVPKKLPI